MKSFVHVYRAMRRMTQKKLCMKIGISRQALTAIERNKSICNGMVAVKMARIFGCSVDDLFKLDDDDLKYKE